MSGSSLLLRVQVLQSPLSAPGWPRARSPPVLAIHADRPASQMETPYVRSILERREAEWFEYTKAANPIRPSLSPEIPAQAFLPDLYADGPTWLMP
jgi:hypothetical protein